MKNWKRFITFALSAALLCGAAPGVFAQEDTPAWNVGFARRQIALPENSSEPLYISGYNSGWEITGLLDLCEARALWLGTGSSGVLLIGVDCIALDSGAVDQIREAIGEIPGCLAINVYATHTHAGPDTLGLWGPMGVDGKNSEYMKNLIAAAAEAGREAAENVHTLIIPTPVRALQKCNHNSSLPILLLSTHPTLTDTLYPSYAHYSH